MSTFAVIYTSPQSVESVMANNDPAAAAASNQAWMDWAARTGAQLKDFGAPLGSGKHLAKDGVSDAPIGVSGYSFVEAGSLDEAVKLMDGHPHLKMPDASIQVYEVLEIPGM